MSPEGSENSALEWQGGGVVHEGNQKEGNGGTGVCEERTAGRGCARREIIGTLIRPWPGKEVGIVVRQYVRKMKWQAIN